MISRAGLRRLTPGASAVLMLAANVPDVDVVSLAFGPAAYVQYHRWVTHAFVAVPFISWLPVLMVWFWARGKLRVWPAYFLSVAGVLSHLLLDYTNTYGIRLLAPFSEQWLSLSITHVFDVWIWLILVGAWVARGIARLVHTEIGSQAPSGRIPALVALASLVLYDGARGVLHHRAVEMARMRLYHGLPPRRVAAVPHPFDPLRWTVLVDTERFLAAGPLRLTEEFDPDRLRLFHQPEANAALEAARQDRIFRMAMHFSPFLVWQVLPASTEGEVLVKAIDMRFGVPPPERFTAQAVVRKGTVVRSWYQF